MEALNGAVQSMNGALRSGVRMLEETTKDVKEREFNPIVFWSVNALWMTCLVVVVIWFWKFKGAERMTQWTRNASSRASDRALARRLQRRREMAEEAKKISPEQHRALLEKSFRRNKVHMVRSFLPCSFGHPVLLELPDVIGCSHIFRLSTRQIVRTGDFIKDESGPFVTDHMDLEDSSQSSSGGFLTLRTESGERTVPNCCAVCLGAYAVGDYVVWSPNRACQHAFHEACVTDWLVKMQGDHPCPCCREAFIDVGNEGKKEKTVNWGAGQSMNLNAISL